MKSSRFCVGSSRMKLCVRSSFSFWLSFLNDPLFPPKKRVGGERFPGDLGCGETDEISEKGALPSNGSEASQKLLALSVQNSNFFQKSFHGWLHAFRKPTLPFQQRRAL